MKHEERKKIAKKFEEFVEKYSEYSGGETTTLSTETISTEVDAGSTMLIPMCLTSMMLSPEGKEGLDS